MPPPPSYEETTRYPSSSRDACLQINTSSYEPHASSFQLRGNFKLPHVPHSQLEEGCLPSNQDLELRLPRLLLPATRKLRAIPRLPLPARGGVPASKSGPRAPIHTPPPPCYEETPSYPTSPTPSSRGGGWPQFRTSCYDTTPHPGHILAPGDGQGNKENQGE